MTDPTDLPDLADILPGLHRTAEDDLAAAVVAEATDPPGYPQVFAAGERLDTLKVDPTSSVTDVRTPERWKPVEAILANQASVPVDRLRLVRGDSFDNGSVTMWEVLALGGDVSLYMIAAYREGDTKLRLTSAQSRTLAEYRLSNARAAFLGDDDE